MFSFFLSLFFSGNKFLSITYIIPNTFAEEVVKNAIKVFSDKSYLLTILSVVFTLRFFYNYLQLTSKGVPLIW